MDLTKFDGVTRRVALRGVLAGALGLAVGGTALQADAKRRKKRGKKQRNGGGNNGGQGGNLPNGAFCQESAQCADANNICAVAFNASNSDLTCCGATGATCGLPNDDGDATAPFCCAGYDCVNGVCQLVPED